MPHALARRAAVKNRNGPEATRRTVIIAGAANILVGVAAYFLGRRNGAARMYGQGGANADVAHVTAIAPAHAAGTVPILVQQGSRRAIRLNAFRYDRYGETS